MKFRVNKCKKKGFAESHVYRPHKSRETKRINRYRKWIYKIFSRFYRTEKASYLVWKYSIKIGLSKEHIFTGTEALYQIHAVQTGTQFNIPPQKAPPGQVWHSKEFEYSKAFASLSLSTSLFCSIHYTSLL